MTPERWQQIDEVLQAALARQAQARTAFLDRACADDEGLRTEVESLLASHEEAGSFLAQPALEIAAESVAAQTHAMMGELVGHYRLIAALGAGGMGEVYLAEDTELGRKVAIKLLPEYAVDDDERVRRFRQEARAASTLSHPNIAHIYEIGETEGSMFLALEYIEGETLAEWIATRQPSIREVVDIAMQIADALDEAHTSGITHRDIKTGNIMLTRRGRVKVLDFGLAKITHVAHDNATALSVIETRSGVVMGTVSYMSPEQALGKVVDHRTDIFSLGVVLYELVTGRLPFKGASATETIDHIAHAQPEAIARFNYDVPALLELIIRKALRKNRDERYQSAHDLLVDLKELKQEFELEGHCEYAIHNSEDKSTNGNHSVERLPSVLAADTGEVVAIHATSSAEYIVTEIMKHRRGAILALSLLVVTIVGTSFGLYRSWNRGSANNALVPWREVTQHRFATHGGVPFRAAISPDGKSLVYRQRINGKDSLWLGHIESNTSVPILEPTGLFVQALTFSLMDKAFTSPRATLTDPISD